MLQSCIKEHSDTQIQYQYSVIGVGNGKGKHTYKHINVGDLGNNDMTKSINYYLHDKYFDSIGIDALTVTQ